MANKEIILSVSELNEGIKEILHNTIHDLIKIKGDVSNVKISNGNTFLTLKDSASQINITYWGGKIENLVNGDEVIVEGYLNCYTKTGTYQIRAKNIEKVGIGMLYEEYTKLKNSFDKKGYFDKSKIKKKLPENINNIGILTSSEGAALQDILYVLNSNAFNGKVFIKNCMVQGINCPKSIKEGIKYFNNLNKKNKLDILIVTRGGGSFEDLMGFSSKEAVKSINKCKIYTISAVGHEIDNMLSDYSADYRAPTPSIAGELVSSINKKKVDMLNNSNIKLMELTNSIRYKLNNYESKIESNTKLLNIINPINILNEQINKLDMLKNNLFNKIDGNINSYLSKINKYTNINNNYDNSKILKSGYTMIVDEDNNIINSIIDYKNGKKLKIIFHNGIIDI